MPKYKAVIFDFDNTLFETRVTKWAQHKHIAKTFYDIDLTDEELLKHWGKPLKTLIGELYQHKDTPENMYQAVLDTRSQFPKKAYIGVLETLNKIKTQGVEIGILSATNGVFLIEDLVAANIPTEDFIVIQGADDTLVHKPDPEVFIPLIEKLKEEGIEKEDIVYVGDSIDDLESAHGAGIDFIAVTTGLYSAEDFLNKGAKVIIENINEVVEYI